jgi:hypothetical protein
MTMPRSTRFAPGRARREYAIVLALAGVIIAIIMGRAATARREAEIQRLTAEREARLAKIAHAEPATTTRSASEAEEERRIRAEYERRIEELRKR